MTHTEQYDRARQLLLSCWPHVWRGLSDVELEHIAEIMCSFAQMETRRAQRKPIAWTEMDK